jgi:transposase
MTLLHHAYSRGVYSSQRIARACEEELAFRAVDVLNQLDFRTTSEFRSCHLATLAGLFVQVLALCRRRAWSDSTTSRERHQAAGSQHKP